MGNYHGILRTEVRETGWVFGKTILEWGTVENQWGLDLVKKKKKRLKVRGTFKQISLNLS
jgi:hypothetical protein